MLYLYDNSICQDALATYYLTFLFDVDIKVSFENGPIHDSSSRNDNNTLPFSKSKGNSIILCITVKSIPYCSFAILLISIALYRSSTPELLMSAIFLLTQLLAFDMNCSLPSPKLILSFIKNLSMSSSVAVL